jgi:non-canonical (house-cleaning) NTP pyrophosphatase
MTAQTSNPTKVVLTSPCPLKLAALEQAIQQLRWNTVVIISLKAAYSLSEQPGGEETPRDADHRIRWAQSLVPEADLYLSIDDDLYPLEKGGQNRQTVVVVAVSGQRRHVAMSEGVEFAAKYVSPARRRGIATTSVGNVTQKSSLLAHQDEQHLSLVGKSRRELLVETIRAALQHIRE